MPVTVSQSSTPVLQRRRGCSPGPGSSKKLPTLFPVWKAPPGSPAWSSDNPAHDSMNECSHSHQPWGCSAQSLQGAHLLAVGFCLGGGYGRDTAHLAKLQVLGRQAAPHTPTQELGTRLCAERGNIPLGLVTVPACSVPGSSQGFRPGPSSDGISPLRERG